MIQIPAVAPKAGFALQSKELIGLAGLIKHKNFQGIQIFIIWTVMKEDVTL